MAKTDIKSAFRTLPLRPDQYNLAVIRSGAEFFVDRCLAIGTSSSCVLFEKVSTALQFIAEKRGIEFLTHFLDDFFMINKTECLNQNDLDIFSHLCKEVGAPLVPEKTVLPAQIQVYQGFEINTVDEVVRLPEDKLKKAIHLITSFLSLSKCTLRELQQPLSLLNWTTTVIIAGRAFLRRP